MYKILLDTEGTVTVQLMRYDKKWEVSNGKVYKFINEEAITKLID